LRFPPTLSVTHEALALRDARLIVIAVPAESLRENLGHILAGVSPDAMLLSAIKGIEAGSGRRMSELIAEAGIGPARTLVLSGPNFSGEIAAGLPAATVIAGADLERARRAQALLTSPVFRVYASEDVAGVEIGGALKNVVAIACGISDGLAMGENAKAALMTRALAEITRLGVAAGARPLTFLGLAGIGDLIATCGSDLSRNRRLGLGLAEGKSLDDALRSIEGVVEGVGTTRAARVLSGRLGVQMPICEELYAVLFEDKDPSASLIDLMARGAKDEFP
jgi:glycerol-3-phosphate dehydrogenase (NAD(P)+)